MKRISLCIAFQLLLASSLAADSNLRITDVGLNGYSGTPSAIRLVVRNPSLKPQPIQLRIAAHSEWGGGTTNAVSVDVNLDGGQERELEVPILVPPGTAEVVADARAADEVFAHDTYKRLLPNRLLVVLMCASDSVCKSAQSQIQFSGTVEDRADKNRQLSFELVRDPRNHWWAYSAANAIVLAKPMTEFTGAQRDALEGFLRRGGRLVLIEKEIADRGFLSAYRQGAARRDGERVGKGTLMRVSDLGTTNALGDAFAGANLVFFFAQERPNGMNPSQMGWTSRFATAFDFPGLRWILIWLLAYIVVIGAVNFAILRRLHRLEFGWISMGALAVLFAVGFYFSSASRRPQRFRLDNLATYYLDGRSPLASADYNLRVSAPERRNVLVSIADPAVFTDFTPSGEESNSQIWSEMNRQRAQVAREFDFRLGPPSQTELPLLKWSFQDLDMEGLREFPGTVHLVATNRLRNDTGQRFSEAVYLDWTTSAAYSLPPLAPGQEVQLDSLTPTKIEVGLRATPPSVRGNFDGNTTLETLALAGFLGVPSQGRMFAGFSDGPRLSVELNVPHEENVHSLFVVSVEQP